MFKYINITLLVIVSWICHVDSGLTQERTVGLLKAEDGAHLRYQLFTAVDHPYAALIDMCGAVINEWELDKVGLTANLLDDGKILVSGRIDDGTYGRPGKMGLLQIRSWDNDVLWETQFTAGKYAAHHDVDVTPEGNLMIILWERFSREDAIAAGRDTSILGEEIWSEAIFEISPVGTDTFDLVWEWHLWDHLIQDRDSTLANYGAIDEHPERWDINYKTRFDDDWIHANGLDYDPIRDEIILCSRDWGEFYVIDHSTTSAEAATSSGGQYNKGGNIIYRWGNPRAYGRGNDSDQQLVAQHDASFDIRRSTVDTLLITAFSNNNDRDIPSANVDIKVPMTGSGSYPLAEDFQSYAPAEPADVFLGNPEGIFDSPFMGSYDVLPNGNSLTCSSQKGEYFEYTPEGELVWHYKMPVGLFGIMTQGDSINGRVFKAYPYELDDSRLDGLDLTPKKKAVELNPLSFDCPYQIISNVDDLPVTQEQLSQLAYLNGQTIELTSSSGDKDIRLYTMSGIQLSHRQSSSTNTILDMSTFSVGLYTLRITHQEEQVAEVFKVVRF